MPDAQPSQAQSGPSEEGLELNDIRAAVLRRMFWTVALLGGLVLVNIEARLLVSGQLGLGLAYLLAYAGILIFVSLPQLPYAARAGMPLLILFAVGTLELWLDRLDSLGLLYYLAVVMIAGALFSARAAFVTVALCAGAIAALGLLFTNGPYAFPLPEPRHPDMGLSWRAALLNFSMLALIGTALHEQLFRGLRASIEASRAYLAEIRREARAREEMERELREREVRLRGIVETSRDWIWAIDLNGHHTYCNPAVENILGYRVEELVNTSAFEFIHEDDRKQVEAFLPGAIADKRGWENLLLRWRHKDGRYRYLESSAVAVLDQEGNLVGFQGVDRDVTERFQANQALRESEVRYRSLFEAANDAIFLMAGERFVDCNPRTLEMFGCERDQILGQPPYRFSPPNQPDGEDSMTAARTLIRAALDGTAQFFEWQHCRFDGQAFDAEVSLNRLELDGDDYLLAIVRDVSERKQTEEALRRSETRNTAILEVLPDIMFCLDGNGVHLDFHVPPGETVFAPLEQITGRTVHELLPQAVADEYMRRVAATIQRGGVEVFEYELDLAGNDTRTFEARMVPQDHDVVLTIVRNITERKQAERRLARYRDQLEDLVRERTQALEEAQKELVRKERLAILGTLTATVAHEIRNPLGTLRNALFSIRTSAADGDQERTTRALRLADKSIGRCDGIITELLDFTRTRSHTKSPTDIDSWLQGVLEEQVVPDGIELAVALGAGCTVEVDAEHLRRAVVCIFSNAIQAMQSEGASGSRLAVTTAVVRGRFEIQIADRGPGIPAEIRQQIFEPLFSTKSFGVGLGVPIARDIMDEHGGGLEYHDGENGGTVAVLWLPVVS